MSNLASPVRAVKPIPPSRVPATRQPRQRRPLLPVSVRATLDLTSPDELAHGTAILAITTGDATDEDTRRYWTQFLFRDGDAYAISLRQFGSDEVHQVTLADEKCSCPDTEFRPDRPGGCKHIRALKIVLPPVAAPAAATATEGTVAA